MTKIRLYLDEDTQDNDLILALRLRNVDVLSTGEAQMLSKSDKEQLQWAFDNQLPFIRISIFILTHPNQ